MKLKLQCILIGLVLIASGCGPVSSTTIEPENSTPSTGEPVQQIQLRINVIEYDSLSMYSGGVVSSAAADESGLIQEAIAQTAAEMGLIEPQVDITLLGSNPDTCHAARAVSPEMYDIIVLDGVCAPHTFQAYQIADVPAGFADNYTDQLFPPGRLGFVDENGNLKAVATGTSPMLMIYNPELMGDLPDPLGFYELPMYFDATKPLVVPPHAAIPVALTQSFLAGFVETDLLNLPFYDQLFELSQPIDDLASNRGLASASTADILAGFSEGKIGATLQSPMFLRMLKMSNYTGPLRVARLPQVTHSGGAAMGLAWAVSGTSENQELASDFLSRLVRNPQLLEWQLANGFLPIDAAGFAQLQQNQELFGQWLDSGLITNEQNFQVLSVASETSPIWNLPASVPMETYNNQVLPRSVDLLNRVFNGVTPVQEGLTEWKAFLTEVGLGQ